MNPDGALTDPNINRAEHDQNASAKRVLPYGWTGTGTQRIPTPFIDMAYDSTTFTNPDVNGNYQTITFKLSGTTVRTLTLAFDASNNVTSIARS